MATNIHLKEQLRGIAQNNYSFSENGKIFPITLDMMDQIGSPDSELRDDLIYSTLATWILRRNLFTFDQLRQLLSIALDDRHIFFSIDEINTDAIFTRSFSVLLLPLILIAHRERPFLTETEIRQTKDMLINYFQREQDLRGFVVGKGWAHTVAHVGDAFDDLAQCLEMGSSDLMDILNSIADKMGFDGAPYVHEEDERMTTAVISVINRHLLEESDIENWIHELVLRVLETKRCPTSFRRINVKNFLRTLYFRLQKKDQSERLISSVNKALEEIRVRDY